MHYNKNTIKQYLLQQLTLSQVQKKLGLSNSQCRYLQSEFNNYIGNEYADINEALVSIELHLR
jgi:hypothetical protein